MLGYTGGGGIIFSVGGKASLIRVIRARDQREVMLERERLGLQGFYPGGSLHLGQYPQIIPWLVPLPPSGLSASYFLPGEAFSDTSFGK